MHREKDDARSVAVFLNQPRGFERRHAWHGNVEQNNVRTMLDNLLERFAGIRMPDVGPGARAFDTGDYAQFVNYVVEQDIPAATAQNLMESYATRLIASGGKGLTPGDFVELRAQYASRLSLEQMNMLQAWIEAVYAQANARAHTLAQQGGR